MFCFNEAIGGVSFFEAQLPLYFWLADNGIFNVADVFLNNVAITLCLPHVAPHLMRIWAMLINHLPVTWMRLISAHPVISEQHIMYKFMEGAMSTHACYEWLMPKNDTCNAKPIEHWAADLCYTVPELRNIWTDLCKHVNNIGNPLIKDFHILFLNRAYQLNSVINKYRPVVSPLCSFGCQESETYLHLFYACPKVKALWHKVKQFYQEFVNDDYLILNEIKCLLSDFTSRLLVIISIVVKRRIFLCRLNNFSLIF